MKPVIFYFHGFASSANSPKVKILAEHFKSKNIKFVAESYNTYDADASFIKISNLVLLNLEPGEIPVFVGTSLGAFWAVLMADKFKGHFAIANPSLFPHVSLLKYVDESGLAKDFAGVNHEFTLKTVHAFEKFVDELVPANLNGGVVLLNKGDEVIGEQFPKIIEMFEGKAKIELLEGGNHRFEDMDKLIEAIEDVVHFNIEVGVENE